MNRTVSFRKARQLSLAPMALAYSALLAGAVALFMFFPMSFPWSDTDLVNAIMTIVICIGVPSAFTKAYAARIRRAGHLKDPYVGRLVFSIGGFVGATFPMAMVYPALPAIFLGVAFMLVIDTSYDLVDLCVTRYRDGSLFSSS